MYLQKKAKETVDQIMRKETAKIENRWFENKLGWSKEDYFEHYLLDRKKDLKITPWEVE